MLELAIEEQLARDLIVIPILYAALCVLLLAYLIHGDLSVTGCVARHQGLQQDAGFQVVILSLVEGDLLCRHLLLHF